MAIKVGGTTVIDDTRNITNIGAVVAESMRLTGNTGITFPSGTTAQRPTNPSSGTLRYNTTLGKFEGYNGATWAEVGAGAGVDGLFSALVLGASEQPEDNPWVRDATGIYYAPGGTEAIRVTNQGGISFGSSGTAVGTSGQALRSAGNGSPTWGTLGTTGGGTGLTSFTANGALYATSTSALTTGTLPTNGGGTGLTSFTANGALYATSTSALTTGTLPTNGGGTGLASFTSGGALYATSTSALTTGTLPLASGGTGATTAAAAQTNLDVPSRAGSGASGSWGISVTGTSTNVTGIVATANGGTGLTSFTSGGALYATSTSAITTGTLPLASGGTGATSSAAAATNLGLGTGNNVQFASLGVGAAAPGTAGSFTATSITETSSIVFKENINSITNALDCILQLKGVTYDRKDGTYKNEAGLIAEEVNKILPNLVTKDKDGNPFSIAYTKLTAYLIESIKELKSELDEIKKNGYSTDK